MPTNPAVAVAVESIQRQCALRTQNRHTRLLAATLCQSYAIPEGKDLVLLLQSDPTVRSNRDAVEAWIAQQLESVEVAESEQILATIDVLFRRKWIAVLEALSCE